MTPWERLSTRLALWRFASVGRGVRAESRLWIHGEGRVHIGDATVFQRGTTGIELLMLHGGHIHIGAGCRIGEGVSIEASVSVSLGDGVVVGPWTKIMDNDFHPLSGDRHKRPPSRPVVIEDGVIIGAHVIILAGVRIGGGADVRANSVVTRNVPPTTVVEGNPARRVLRE